MDEYHLQTAQAVKKRSKGLGMNLIGNYFTGVSVNDCLYHPAVEMQDYMDSRYYQNFTAK